MRRIALQLAPDTTATHCGSCQFLDGSPEHDCAAFGVNLDSQRERVNDRGTQSTVFYELRHELCIAAEVAAMDPAATVDTVPPEAA